MGLDQFLYRNIYIGAHYEHNEVTGQVNLYTKDKRVDIRANKIVSIKEMACEWRKCNQIHGWFERYVESHYGEPLENCKSYDINRPDLEELLSTINTLLEDRDEEKAKELLPVTPEFFFGSTEYDEWYWENLEDTKEQLSDALNYDGEDNVGFRPSQVSYTYYAWW